MRIKIKVTKEILNKTKSCVAMIDSCAIAEAVRDIFPNAYVVYSKMYPFPISYTKKGAYEIDMPLEAVHFQRYFDSRQSDEERANMNAISFNIEVPDKIIDLIGICQLESILSNSLTLEKV